MTPTPEHKLGSLLHKHREVIINALLDAQQIANEALQSLSAGNDEALNLAARRLDQAAGSIRSRLLQIRAVKDTASAIGVKPGQMNGIKL